MLALLALSAGGFPRNHLLAKRYSKGGAGLPPAESLKITGTDSVGLLLLSWACVTKKVNDRTDPKTAFVYSEFPDYSSLV